MRTTLLLLAFQIVSIISQDVPQPTLVCRGVGCSQALAPVSPVLQKRLSSGLVQTCFFNRCQISGPGFFSTQSCFGGASCSQTFSSSSSFSSPGTQSFSKQASLGSPVNRSLVFGAGGTFDNIFGPGGHFPKYLERKDEEDDDMRILI